MNRNAAIQWVTASYTYARNSLSLAAAEARVYAVKDTNARANNRCLYLWLEQYAAANLTA